MILRRRYERSPGVIAIATAAAIGLCVSAAVLLIWAFGRTPAPEIADGIVATTTSSAAAPTITTPMTSSTTQPTTSTTMPTTTTTTTTPPRRVQVLVGDESSEITLSPFGWILPETGLGGTPVGADLADLFPFVPPNDGAFGVNIDEAFLDEHANAVWLAEENGVPVIDRIDATGRCLNILTPIVLRRSFVSCPTRIQSDTWGYAGTVDDAPAVNISPSVEGVLIEHNTITCTGFDADICGRSVRIGARDAMVRFNDLSHARGAVSLFHDSTFVFNYLHDFSFGLDPTRENSDTDRITHNNSINNLGYQNVLVAGNFIDATYGRVSLEPEKNLNPFYRDAYPEGIVREGDPINGFAFTNYLVNGDGAGAMYLRNYVRSVGRPFRCNSSANQVESVCVEAMSFNVFADLRIEQFNSEPPFDDKDGEGDIRGECNFRMDAGVLTLLELPDEERGQSCESRLELSIDDQAEFAFDVGSTRFVDQ